MSSHLAAAPSAPPAGRAGGGPALAPLTCRLCGAKYPPAPSAVCEQCLGPLEPITGNGLKTVEAVQPALGPAPVIEARLREVAALVNAAR